MFPILRTQKCWSGKKQAGFDVLTLRKDCHSLMHGHDWNREKIVVNFVLCLEWDTRKALKICQKSLQMISGVRITPIKYSIEPSHCCFSFTSPPPTRGFSCKGKRQVVVPLCPIYPFPITLALCMAKHPTEAIICYK